MRASSVQRTLAFCLESKIRHSTITETIREEERMFCLESKIRHSTICTVLAVQNDSFALNPK